MSIQKICIVGAGNLSTKRIYPLIGQAGAHLVGVCDLDAAKAKKNATLWGGNVYADMEKMLDTEKPECDHLHFRGHACETRTAGDEEGDSGIHGKASGGDCGRCA